MLLDRTGRPVSGWSARGREEGVWAGAREVQDGVGLVAGADHHALAGAVQDLAIVDHAYALGAAGQGLARHIEEIGQPGQAGGKRVGDLRSVSAGMQKSPSMGNEISPTSAFERRVGNET